MENHVLLLFPHAIQALLKRLQERKPQYQTDSMAIEEQKRHKLVQSVCAYPYVLSGNSSLRKTMSISKCPSNWRFRNPSATAYPMPSSLMQARRPSTTSLSQPLLVTSGAMVQRESRPATHQDSRAGREDWSLMCKTRRLLGGKPHSIEISVSGR